MKLSMYYVAALIAIYFALWAVTSQIAIPFMDLLFGKLQAVAVVVGSVISIPISARLFTLSTNLGLIAIALCIGLMCIILFSGLIPWLIRLIPEAIRKFFRKLWRILGVVTFVIIIVIGIFLILKFWTWTITP